MIKIKFNQKEVLKVDSCIIFSLKENFTTLTKFNAQTNFYFSFRIFSAHFKMHIFLFHTTNKIMLNTNVFNLSEIIHIADYSIAPAIPYKTQSIFIPYI